MREKSAVALFLLALGGIKLFEYRNEELEDGEFERDYQYEKFKKKSVQKRSLDSQIERWAMGEFAEELLEVQNGAGMGPVLDCTNVAEDECSCSYLQCFGTQLCHRNVTGGQRQAFIRCRSAVVYDQILCECKRYTKRSWRRAAAAAAPPPPPAHAHPRSPNSRRLRQARRRSRPLPADEHAAAGSLSKNNNNNNNNNNGRPERRIEPPLPAPVA